MSIAFHQNIYRYLLFIYCIKYSHKNIYVWGLTYVLENLKYHGTKKKACRCCESFKSFKSFKSIIWIPWVIWILWILSIIRILTSELLRDNWGIYSSPTSSSFYWSYPNKYFPAHFLPSRPLKLPNVSEHVHAFLRPRFSSIFFSYTHTTCRWLG